MFNIVIFSLCLIGGSTVVSGKAVTTTLNPWNDLVDSFLYYAFDNSSTIPLPDIEHKFVDKFLGINWNSNVALRGGRLGNLTTLKRAGSIKAYNRKDNGALVLQASFTFRDLRLYFDEFSFKFLGLGVNDTLAADCRKNQVSLQLTWFNDNLGGCSLTLDNFKVTSLGRFTVKILPSTFIDKIKSIFATATLEVATPIIKYEMNKRIPKMLQQRIRNLNICGQIPR